MLSESHGQTGDAITRRSHSSTLRLVRVAAVSLFKKNGNGMESQHSSIRFIPSSKRGKAACVLSGLSIGICIYGGVWMFMAWGQTPSPARELLDCGGYVSVASLLLSYSHHRRYRRE